MVQIQKIYAKRFNRKGDLKKYAEQKHTKFNQLIHKFQRFVMGMTFLKCEKMLETIVHSGELQNEPISEEVKVILLNTMKKIRFIDNRLKQSDLASTTEDHKHKNHNKHHSHKH